MNEWFVLCWSNVRSQAMGRGQRTQQQPASDGEGAACGGGAGHHFTPDIVFTVLRWGVFRRWSGES